MSSLVGKFNGAFEAPSAPFVNCKQGSACGATGYFRTQKNAASMYSKEQYCIRKQAAAQRACATLWSSGRIASAPRCGCFSCSSKADELQARLNVLANTRGACLTALAHRASYTEASIYCY